MSEQTTLTQDMILEASPLVFGMRVNYVNDLDTATKTGLFGYIASSCAGLPTGMSTNGNVVVHAKSTTGEIMQTIYPHSPWKGYIMIKRVRFNEAAGWQHWYGIKGEILT